MSTTEKAQEILRKIDADAHDLWELVLFGADCPRAIRLLATDLSNKAAVLSGMAEELVNERKEETPRFSLELRKEDGREAGRES